MPLAYSLLRSSFSVIARAYFRQIVVVGLEHVPTHGPVVFAANHPSALVDPLLLVVASPRVVRFAAKEPLFRSWWLGPILRAMQAVALQRRQDVGANVDNSEAFRSLFAALANDEAIGIFPEGISHAGSKIAALKTGAARIALGAKRDQPDKPVCVVPVGLNYRSGARFRSQVLVQFGEPIAISSDLVKRHASDEVAAVGEYTQHIAQGLHALTINADDWQTLQLLDLVRRFYHPKNAPLTTRLELTRRFLTAYQSLKGHPDIEQLAQRVWDYQLRLRELGLRDAQVAAPASFQALAAKTTLRSLVFFAALVAGIPGFLALIPALLVMEIVGRKFRDKDADVAATANLLTGLVFVPLTVLPLLAVAYVRGGLLALSAWLLLLPLALASALYMLDRFTSYRRLLVMIKHHIHHRAELRELAILRATLVDEITTTVQSLHPHAESLIDIHRPVATEPPTNRRPTRTEEATQ